MNKREFLKTLCLLPFVKKLLKPSSADWWTGATPKTLFIMDEGSGISPKYFVNSQYWVKRMIIIGSPRSCNANWFKRATG